MNNLKTSLRFPCLGFNPIIDSFILPDVKCPCLAAPERGTVCIDGDQSPGTEAYYECEFDRIGGDSDRMCQRDGTWTGEEAVCSTG